MRRVAVALSMGALFVSLCCPLPGIAQEDTKAQDMRKQDRYHTAIMSYGSYSSPMSWDRKTIIITEDGQIVKEEIYAPNKEFYAQADIVTGRTTVFGMVRQGSFGRRVERWFMPGCHELLGLSGDGDRLVLGCRTKGRAIRGSDPDRVILTFVERGTVFREIRFGEIEPDIPETQDADTAVVWGRYRRLNAAGHYVIEAMEQTPIVFDVRTGERIGLLLDETADIEGWRRYVDVYNWLELQYSGDCTIRVGDDIEGYPTGGMRLERGDTGWIVTTAIERIDDYGADKGDVQTFVEFAINRAKVMNCADGPTSSTYADSVISQTVFTNPHGIEVLELSFSVVHAEWTEEGEGTIERSTRGPIYALLLAPNQDEPRNVLFLSPAHGVDREVGSDDLLRRIVDTIGYP
jgi:hypothetical protein